MACRRQVAGGREPGLWAPSVPACRPGLCTAASPRCREAALRCPILTRSPLMPMSPLNPGKPSSPWTRDGREGLSPRGSAPTPGDSVPTAHVTHGPLPPQSLRERGPQGPAPVLSTPQDHVMSHREARCHRQAPQPGQLQAPGVPALSLLRAPLTLEAFEPGKNLSRRKEPGCRLPREAPGWEATRPVGWTRPPERHRPPGSVRASWHRGSPAPGQAGPPLPGEALTFSPLVPFRPRTPSAPYANKEEEGPVTDRSPRRPQD